MQDPIEKLYNQYPYPDIIRYFDDFKEKNNVTYFLIVPW